MNIDGIFEMKHPRTDEVAALDDRIALYIHACEMEKALRGVMSAIEQNTDSWVPKADPPFYPDAHVGVTLKASECEAVYDSLSNDGSEFPGNKA